MASREVPSVAAYPTNVTSADGASTNNSCGGGCDPSGTVCSLSGSGEAAANVAPPSVELNTRMLNGGAENGEVVHTTTSEPSSAAATDPLSAGAVASSAPAEQGVVHGSHVPAGDRAASINCRSLYNSHDSLLDEATRTSSAGPAPGCIVDPEGSNASAPTGDVKIWKAGVVAALSKENTA